MMATAVRLVEGGLSEIQQQVMDALTRQPGGKVEGATPWPIRDLLGLKHELSCNELRRVLHQLTQLGLISFHYTVAEAGANSLESGARRWRRYQVLSA